MGKNLLLSPLFSTPINERILSSTSLDEESFGPDTISYAACGLHSALKAPGAVAVVAAGAEGGSGAAGRLSPAEKSDWRHFKGRNSVSVKGREGETLGGKAAPAS